MRGNGHRVLITGGSRGIGLALARRFHSAGNHVTIVGRDRSALAAAAAQLPGVVVEVADVTIEADRARLLQGHGDLSVLVNNAGIQCNGAFIHMDAAMVQHELETNLTAPLLLCRAFLPTLAQQTEAAIVNVSSALAIVPKASAAVYCASKAAIRSFSRALRWQLEGSGVRVFELAPPLVDTAMSQGRGSHKLSPEQVAHKFWNAYIADDEEILIGAARVVRLLDRLAPHLIEAIVRRRE